MQRDGNKSIFESLVGSWYESLRDPAKSQMGTLLELTKEYEQTYYGKSHHATKVRTFEDFRRNFPVINYRALSPYIAEVRKGNYKAILPSHQPAGL